MKLINQMNEELISICQEWNSGEITFEERNLRIDLLLLEVEQLQVNFGKHPLQEMNVNSQNVLKQLLNRHKFKAKTALNSLKKLDTKRNFNANARHIIKHKLYFAPLHRTLQRNISAYAFMNRMNNVDEFQLFINEKENDKNG